MKYKVMYLKEGDNLETFDGKIIKVLDASCYSGFWSFTCLVELGKEENEKEN